MKVWPCLILLIIFTLTACSSKPVANDSDANAKQTTPDLSKSSQSTPTPVSIESSQFQGALTTKNETSSSNAETPNLLNSDRLTPYQILSEIRKIEGVSGGTYAGVGVPPENGEYNFYLTDFFIPNTTQESQIKTYRVYDVKTGDVKYYLNDKLTNYYNLFKPETYPKMKSLPYVDSRATDQLKLIYILEQQLYVNNNICNVEWSPDYSVVAYSQGKYNEGEAYVWFLNEDRPRTVESGILPEHTFLIGQPIPNFSCLIWVQAANVVDGFIT
ncbi:hypothetical protein NV379_23015 [Paenibacillus sp. N1-5-1-14]|uniref:hypothetical protein n=1 Tax=Paenibacillus radicibacter TaxID=2972488 RepID=UPI00215921EC|nr:hypothetical protein [Paenibacillus radicibacter]MCR8645512.1 hypothetical protein [Paenibacillus radicibacter]